MPFEVYFDFSLTRPWRNSFQMLHPSILVLFLAEIELFNDTVGRFTNKSPLNHLCGNDFGFKASFLKIRGSDDIFHCHVQRIFASLFTYDAVNSIKIIYFDKSEWNTIFCFTPLLMISE